MSSSLLLAGIGQSLVGILMFLTALFLILLVLVQRGRGGGLAGAFGGMGGQSAFGAKAGDTFTKITIFAAAFWILLCMAAVKFMGDAPAAFGDGSEVRKTVVDPDDNTESDDLGTADSETADLGPADLGPAEPVVELEGAAGDGGESGPAESDEETE